MSGVVLLEMTASARDDSQRKIYERMFRDYRKDNSLIIPNHDDWLQACKFSIGLTKVVEEPLEVS